MTLQVDEAAEETLSRIVGSLRLRREQVGLSRQALSLRLPVRQGTIFAWEKGTDQPTLRNLILWARALGLRLVIVGPDGNERRGSSKPIAGEPIEARALRRLAIPLKNLRVARGLTLVEVSESFGVDRNSLLRWEKIRVTPRPIALIVWANALNCSLALQPISPGREGSLSDDLS